MSRMQSEAEAVDLIQLEESQACYRGVTPCNVAVSGNQAMLSRGQVQLSEKSLDRAADSFSWTIRLTRGCMQLRDLIAS